MERCLVGFGVDQDAFDALAVLAGTGIVVERGRPDFTALVTNAALSITAALGVSFPFNIVIGIPLYIELARRLQP